MFDEVPALYDRVRPTYPDELFADLAAITGMDKGSSVLEVGCGTGQATRSLAPLACSVTAVELGAGMGPSSPASGWRPSPTSRLRRRHSRSGTTVVGTSMSWWLRQLGIGSIRLAARARRAPPCRMDGTARQRRRPPVGRDRGLRRIADLHERDSPGNPDWGHPPLEDEVPATGEGRGLVDDPGPLFGPTIVRWYPLVQWFDGEGFADLLRSTSCTGGSPRAYVSRCSTRSPIASTRGWAIACRAAT